MKVKISNGNIKMGYIKSVSLPPVVTCAEGCTCAKDCYGIKMCKRYPSVKKSYENNLAIYLEDSDEYFLQIQSEAFTQRFFRWHVCGDIVDEYYFTQMVRTAHELSDTIFLAFTKKYDIVNEYVNKYGDFAIPNNLVIIFSAWKGMKLINPHNFPVAFVCRHWKKITDKLRKIFKRQHVHLCGGDCTECCKQGVGCFYAKKGGRIALPKH